MYNLTKADLTDIKILISEKIAYHEKHLCILSEFPDDGVLSYARKEIAKLKNLKSKVEAAILYAVE